MRYLRMAVALLALTASSLFAQTNAVTRQLLQSSAFDPNIAGTWDFLGGALRMYGGNGAPDPLRCDADEDERVLYMQMDSGEVHGCFDHTGGWDVVSGGVGGSGEFEDINSGTNTDAAMVVGSGASLITSGTGYIARAGSKILEVCKSGCQYTTICGMTVGGASGSNCSTATDATCVAGSAIKAIKDAGDYSVSNPYTVKIGTGIYNECVALDNITDVTLYGEGQDKVIVRPTVTTATDVDNGVLRIGNSTTTVNSTARIEVSGMTFWNDAFGAPEAGCQAGRDAGPTNGVGSSWNDVYLHDMRCIGNHDGQQVFGGRLTTDGDVPRFVSKNVRVISGADAAAVKGFVNAWIIDMDALSESNWCESTDTARLGTSTGTIASGTSTTVFTLPATETSPSQAPSSTNDFYVGRRIVLAGTGCTAGNTEGDIIDYNGTTRAVTVGAALGFTPAATCTYTMHGVANFVTGNTLAKPGCTDIDWSVIRGSLGSYSAYWKMTGFHMGTGNAQSEAPASAITRVQGSRFVVNMNDLGPPNGAGGSCSAQTHVSGILAYISRWQDAYIDNSTVEVNINTEISNQNTGCSHPINGVALLGTAAFDGAMNISNTRVTVNNAGDPNGNVAAFVVDSTATASTMNVSNVYAFLNTTVGSYTGTEAYLVQAGDEVLTLSGIESPEAVTISGSITSGAARAGAMHIASLTADAVNLPDNSVTGADIALTSQATGDIMYYNGTDWVRLAKGTAGQVLEMNAGATAPEWDTDDTGGGGANSFQTWDAPTGTDPVASSATDTMTLTGADGVVIEGDSSTDELTFSFDSTQVPPTTSWGVNTTITHTYRAGAIDPVITFTGTGSGNVDISTAVTATSFTADDNTAEPGNLIQIPENATAFINDPTCANSGAALKFTMIDSDESASAVQWDVCEGTSLKWRWPATSTTATHFLSASGTAGVMAFEAIAAGDLPSAIDAAKIGGGGVSTTEFDFLGSITSNVQTQIDAKLALAGGTLTGQLVTDNLGIEFDESDTNPTCASGNYNIYADTSEAKLKKCTDGVVSDLAPAGGSGIAETLLDAKGDIIAASAADTAARLAVSATNGRALVAASAETTGLAWQGATQRAWTSYYGFTNQPQSMANTSGGVADDTLVCARVDVPAGTTFAPDMARWYVAATGGGTDIDFCAYDLAGTTKLLDQDCALATAQFNSCTISSPYTFTAGSYHMCFLIAEGGTDPTFGGITGATSWVAMSTHSMGNFVIASADGACPSSIASGIGSTGYTTGYANNATVPAFVLRDEN